VYHQYGPISWEMQDTMFRLDKAVGDLVALAERAAGGRANLLVVLSADHGGAAAPEYWTAQGMEARRVNPRELSKGLTEVLRQRFGGDVTATVEELDVYLGEDERPYEGEYYGLGRVFPHPLTGGLTAPGPESYSAFAISPLSLDLVVRAAGAALAGEGLGKDEVPDLLAVSFSATDRVYHQYGPNSWEMQDTMFRLDKAVGDLVALAERAAGGRANLLVVLSADHGGAAAPEYWTAQGMEARRVNPKELSKGLTEALRQRFGGDVTATVEELDVYLGGKALEGGKVDGAAVRRAAADWLGKQPAISLAVASDDLPTLPDVAGLAAALRRGYYPGRSGDVLFVVKPFHVISAESSGTNHGTPYAYDQLVPLVLAGKGVKPGIYPREISTTDVAPTVAAVLEMNLPASAEGEPRHEALVPSR
ncbi:MAG TPA: alkaline phosphatase family protein, partial [Cystobacter sp.]